MFLFLLCLFFVVVVVVNTKLPQNDHVWWFMCTYSEHGGDGEEPSELLTRGTGGAKEGDGHTTEENYDGHCESK